MRILVFAAADLAREELVAYLSERGHEASGRPDLDAALAALEEEEPGVVLLYRDIPWQDSALFAATARVRKRAVRIVAVLPAESTESAGRLEGAGVTEVVHGESSPAEILEALERSVAAACQPDLTNFGKVSEGELKAIQDIYCRAPDNPRCQWLMGFAFYRNGRFEEAFPILQEVLERDPVHVRARYYLGSCHFRLDRPGEAAELWRQVVERHPGTPQARRAAKHLRKLP